MMGISPGEPAVSAHVRAKRPPLGAYLDRENVLGYVLVFPALLILTVFIAYPFLLGIWFSLTDKMVGQSANFVGVSNFARLLGDSIFLQTTRNTLLYTVSTVTLKLVLGMALALLMNQHFPMKNIVRASLLLPWIVPTALSTLAWLWIFDPTYSVANWVIVNLGLGGKVNWLGNPTLAMTAIIIVNVWRGVPFFAITLLAALQMVSQELHEAAAIDGANVMSRFWHVTVPTIRPVILLVVIFSTIWTISDFQLVYVLTRGGPSNSTHLFATLAYQVALVSARLGEGAAISLYMFPFLLIAIGIVLWQIRRD
jgi:multiple sugar transport system permease protein